MNRTSSFKKILIVLGLLIAVLCAGYYLFFQYIISINQHIASLQSDLMNVTEKKNQIDSSQKMITLANPDIATLTNSLVATDGDVAFIEHIESLAHTDGLNITIDSLSLEDDPALRGNPITTFVIHAQAKGVWSGVYLFASQLELLTQQVKIESLEMTKTDDQVAEKTPGEWQVIFKIRVLKYK